ncbi:MAG TPA: hypothetical protein V6D29_11720 [Leptolyngbyaceae cyanobacterium]
MTPLALKQIRLERLVLALAAIFLLADNVPHPQLGSSLTGLGVQEIQKLMH